MRTGHAYNGHMKISVVIPARNEDRMIDACLKALEDQTVSAAEIIIVDNNSTDDTARRALKHPGVVVIAEPRLGISYGRNAGFDRATGDIIARIDADTVVTPGWIAEITRYFEGHESVVAITGPASFYDVPRRWRGLVDWLFIDSFYWITRRSTGGETLFGSNCAVRRLAWEKIRSEVCMDDANMHEDIDLGQHVQRVGLIAFDDDLRVGISARPLLHPRGMVKRWRKGLNNFSRHRAKAGV